MKIKSQNFYKSVIPAICSIVVAGMYVVVDGIFVGQGVGTNGLAAVNIALPLVLISSAVFMMLSMGGGTLTSIFIGRGDKKKANNAFNTTIFAAVAFSLLVTIPCLIMPEAIAKLLGASENLINDSATYVFYYMIFSTFWTISISLSVFVKNDDNPNLAMIGMIVGAITNIFLDWLFIFPFQMGIMGAAIASGLGQVTACIVLSMHFIKKKGSLRFSLPKKEKGLLLEIMKIGAPEFVTQMSQPICVLLFNMIVIEAFGDIGVAAFSVTSYILSITISIFIGLAQGIQPLLSRCLGEQKYSDIEYYLKKGLKLNAFMSIIIYITMLFMGEYIIRIFNSDIELIKLTKSFLDIYGISFLFASFNIVFTTYFLAIKKTKQSLIIAFLRSFIANSIFIIITPMILGEDFIFLGIAVAEAIVMIVSFALYKKDKLLNERGGLKNA